MSIIPDSIEFKEFIRPTLISNAHKPQSVQDLIFAEIAIRFSFPNEFYVIRDRYETRQKITRLCRDLIAHSADLANIQATYRKARLEFGSEVFSGHALPLDHEFMINDIGIRG